MRKEIIFAIFAGLLLGLVIAFGVWRTNNVFKPVATTQENSDKVSETPLTIGGLTIADPQENDVITESPVLLTGLTSPNTAVIISGETEDYVVTAEATGEFEQEVALTGGVNQIIVSSLDNNSQERKTVLTVVYSTEFESDSATD